MAGGMAEVVECLPRMLEALSANVRILKRKREKQKLNEIFQSCACILSDVWRHEVACEQPQLIICVLYCLITQNHR
jgi:hypothetical protein